MNKKIAIKTLVDKFSNDINHYKNAKYNETQLRTDFLDPFFELLGWDITNKSNKKTNEREVLVEEALHDADNGIPRKPDYTFRLFSERKFFLEAKKPNVKIDQVSAPAQQVRRYGFTAKLKISILSNFEYLAIYDCTKEVKASDTAQYSRLDIYHFKDYIEKFDEISKKIGHDSVYSGQFDDYWSQLESNVHYTSVDVLFLGKINGWRKKLGQDIYKYNPNLNSQELNDIVQKYLNCIIFLRVCEDRNIEKYKTLLNYSDTNNFNALYEQLKTADRKYNAGLFKNLFGKELVESSSSAFWSIIKELYYPDSTFSFSVFSSDILGDIYEHFLAYNLTIHNSNIEVTKKQENLDRDIVTTPLHIIKDILNETVVKYCEHKKADEILHTRIADIACGSGAFLLETYQILQDILVDYYLVNDKSQLIPTGVNQYKLKFHIKQQLLSNCLFGVDKDFNAVEACRFGLFLKLLENEDVNSIPEPALPNIDNVINYGNSLIESENVCAALSSEINPYNFDNQQFDIIIGNPPYMSTTDMKNLTPSEFKIHTSIYTSAYKQYDKYYLFIERCLKLLKPNGLLGYIIPSKFMKVVSALKLRSLLITNRSIKKIISFGAIQIFKGKSTYTCLLFLKNDLQDKIEYLEVQSLADWKSIQKINMTNQIEWINYDDLNPDNLVIMRSVSKKIHDSIKQNSTELGILLGNDNIYNGIQTSANKIYVHKEIKKDSHFVYFIKDGREWKIEKELTKPYFQTDKAVNFSTYKTFQPNSFVIFPYLDSEDGPQFVTIETLQSDFPEAFSYFFHYKTELEQRDISPAPKSPDEWYIFGRHQCLDKCGIKPKIIVKVLSQGSGYAIDFNGVFISSGGTAGYCMITIPENSQYSIYYIQALLNSKYLEFIVGLYGEIFKGGYVARGTKVLQKLPIRNINFNNPSEKIMHDQISNLQQELIALQSDIDSKNNNQRLITPLIRQFEITEKKLNNLLKQLYNIENDDMIETLLSEIHNVID